MIDTRGYIGKLKTADIITDFTNKITEIENTKFKKTNSLELTYADLFKFTFTPQSDYNVRFAVKKSESEIFSGGLVLGNVNANANCRFRIAENESICVFEIATFSANKQENLFNNQIVMIKYGDDYLIAYQIIADASAAKADALSQGFIDNTRIINRLPYCHTFNNIEIIESKVIVGNTDYLDKITKIFDCSNISAQNQYTFNGKNYYAINTNTLMEV